MSVIFEQYSERLRRKRRSPHTLRGFHVATDRLDRWLLGQGLTAETAQFTDLEDYFDGLELGPHSKGVHLRMVQAAYNYAIKRGAIQHNPALDVEVEQPLDKEPRIISGTELRAIRDSITWTHDWLFFHLLAYTGMRRGEIQGLRWDDGGEGSLVRLEDQTLRVIGKGGKLRLIPIHPALAEELVTVKRKEGHVVTARGGAKIGLDTLWDMSKRLHEKYTPHDYRRTVATSMARNDVPERIIDRIMGWAPRSVRGRYYVNIATAELHRGILRLYADDPV